MAGTVFGSPGYFAKGHAFAFWEAGGLVLKLAIQDQQTALGYDGARRYTVPRASASDWILVPAGDGPDQTTLLELLKLAYQFVAGEPPKGLASTPENGRNTPSSPPAGEKGQGEEG